MGWWDRNIVEPGKLPLLLTCVAFVVTFLTTRTITRLIRAGRGPFKNNVTSSGLHIHHSVPGIVLLIAGAFIAVGTPNSAARVVAGVLVGVGSSLVLDEFAMILHMSDVYWQQAGQASVQAVALTAMCLFAALIGLHPLGVDDVGSAERAVRVSGAIGLLLAIVAVVFCAWKGKYRLGLLAVFLPPVALVGAVRLARPESRWAKRFYGPKRMQESTERTARFDARWGPVWRRLADLVAGAPSIPTPTTAAAPHPPTAS